MSSSSSSSLSQLLSSASLLQLDSSQDLAVRQFSLRKLLKVLDEAHGNGTSMITLIIRPGDQISDSQRMLVEEYGKSERIKSRVNRLSVQSAITSTQQALKRYTKVPPNGLVIFCGTVSLPDSNNKERLICHSFEPFKPINTSGYLCDNKFHTESLKELLDSDDKFGFIVIDGSGALFALVSGSSREVLYHLTVSLPKKHGRGGQSALRFARLRLESRHNYLRRVSELATQLFIANDRPNVRALVLAGCADFKSEFSKSDLFDPRLSAIVIKIVDVGYGGENGFNQAIELSSDDLSNVKYVQEVRLISHFFDEIAQDSQKVAYGLECTLKALEAGAVETLILWEELPTERFVIANKDSGEKDVVFGTEEVAEKNGKGKTEVIEAGLAVEWFADNVKHFGCKVEFVSDRSQEGTQFVRGFGGVGALLRYPLVLTVDDDAYDEEPSEN